MKQIYPLELRQLFPSFLSYNLCWTKKLIWLICLSGTSLFANNTYIINDDFDPGIELTNWAFLDNASANNNCGSVSGNALYFTNTGVRQAATIGMYALNGGTISFYLKIADGGGSPCENADGGDEVEFQYSIDQGASWNLVQEYGVDSYPNFTYIEMEVPLAAQTSNTMFRWVQPSHSGSSFDNWAIDEVSITTQPKAPNDAGVISTTLPDILCAGNINLEAIIENFGTDTLFDVTINWEFDGVLQSPITYNTPIDTVNSGNNTASIALGSKTFSLGQTYDLKIWTSDPNGQLDTININDTLNLTLSPGLEGVMTIGGVTPDFNNFSEAVNFLNVYGVCDSLTFNVRNGTYNEQINLGEVLGADSLNNITFQSESGDSSDVILTFSGGSANNYTIFLNGTDWIHFNALTIEALSSTYNRGIEIANGANHISFTNCQITSTVSGNYTLVYIYGINEYLHLKNNNIQGGYYGIAYDGDFNGGNYIKGLVVENNVLSNQMRGGLNFDNQNLPSINNNNIFDGEYGIVLWDSYNGGQVVGNQVYNISNEAGILLNNVNGSPSNPFLLANNFVQVVGVNSNQGIYSNGGSYQYIMHNTVNLTNNNITSSAFYNQNGNNKILQNNIFSNLGGGYAIYTNSISAMISDYNNLYTSGTYLGYNNQDLQTLADWQANSGLDNSSISFDPIYQSNETYKVREVNINNKGSSNPFVSLDIEGEARSATNPDMGADEWSPPSLDITLLDVINPNNPFTSGLQSVDILLRNIGLDTIQNLMVDWKINNTPQTQVSWTGTLVSGSSDTLSLGNFTFNSGQLHNLEVWSSMPNGMMDLVPENDTLKVDSLIAGLGGTYTIGGTSPDFATFTEAIAALEAGGVVDSVNFIVRNGTYNEQLSIDDYIGADSSRWVTFQSETGDSTQVILTYNAGSSDNYTLRFNGADYVTFKGMTIEATNTSYGIVVELTNESNHIHIENNILRGVDVNSTSTGRSIIYSISSYKNEFFKLKNNRLLEGSYGLYYTANTSHVSGTEIIGNHFTNQYTYGIILDEHNTPRINNNIITTDSPYSGFTGIYSNDSNLGGEVIGNQVFGHNYTYGIYIVDMEGTVNDRSLIANNFVEQGAGTSTSYGLYFSSNSYQDIYNNTIHLKNTNSSSSAFRNNSSFEIRLLNNIFSNKGGGLAFRNETPSAITTSDYNNLYTTGDFLIYSGGTNWSTLNEWQNGGNTTEANSISENPYFISTFGYQTAQSALNGAAQKTPLVLTDIEGEIRDTLSPDIGADEFDLPAKDAGITIICPPDIPFATGKHLIQATLQNFGQDTINNVTINWSVNNNLQTAINWSGTLLSGDTIKVTLDSVDFALGQLNNIVSWTSDPDGMTDLIPVNDTARILDLSAGLGGIYTIGGASPDFLNFNEAASALNTGGVVDAVTFNVRDGNYNEQIVLNEIIGVDSLNTVTFQSESGDSSAVVLTFNSSSSQNFTVKLNGSDWFNFHRLTFQSTNANYGNIIELTNGSTHNSFSNNEIVATNNTYDINVYETGTGINEKNEFINNKFKNGGHGIYLNGNYNNDQYIQGTIIKNNYFEGFRYNSMYVRYQLAIEISKNLMISGDFTSNYNAIHLSNCQKDSRVIKNQITNKVRGIGIYLDFVQGTSTQKLLVANNFLKMQGDGTYDAYGIYSYYGSYHQIYHNSVSITNPNVNASAIYLSNGNDKEIYNNIFSNFGQGFSYFVTNVSAITASNYNDLYTNGTNIGYWNGNQPDLAAWQLTSNQDTTSLSVNPGFINDTTDLHVSNVLLDKAGKALLEVTDDFDGHFRDPIKPDIGADEFSTAQEDAGVISIDSPIPPFAASAQPINITLLNNGLDTLESVEINWEVNGILQPSYNWTGNLLSGQQEDSLNLGDFTFEIDTAYTLRSWTSMPNNLPDTENFNDTASLSPLYAGLDGVYTIGGVNPDFQDFTAAVTAMTRGGVLGAVTFDVRDGTYQEQISIPEIFGADSLNTITFQSETGDTTAVILTNAITNFDSNYTVQLDGADWITFKEMTIQSTAPSYTRAIDVRNGAHHNTIENNLLRSVPNTINSSIIYSENNGINNNYTLIQNNIIENGTYGITWHGNSNELGNQFIGNYISNLTNRGLNISNQQAVKILENRIELLIGNEGIYCSNCDGKFDISKNQLIGNFSRGIYLTGCDGSANNRALVSNNFVQNGGTSGSDHGIYLTGSDYIDLVYNTVRTINTATSSVSLYLNSGSNLSVLNNVFANFGGGRAIYVGNSNIITSSDHNDFFTTGANIGFWNGEMPTLIDWQTASNQDANSFSIDPNFIATDDFHIEEVDLNKTGTPITNVLEDLDGESRNSSTPDIGADEFMPITTNDAEITYILSPNVATPFPEGVQPVLVELKNNGADTLVNATISWETNGIQQTSYNWLGFLRPGERDTLTLGNHNFTIGFGNSIEAFTQNPNGLPDNNPENDTAKVLDLHPGLQGIYTIGGVFPDFASFSAATNALNKGGVLGAVTFNVRNGNYEEQIVIQEINGSSATNNIVFQSETQDSSKVKLHFGGTSANNYVIRLDGADHITLRYMTFEETGGSYNTVLDFRNGTHNIVIANNRITTTSTTSSDELVYSSSIQDDNNQFLNNHIIGGGEGIYLIGQSTSQLERQTIISNNVFEQQSNYGIYLNYQDAPQIAKNTIITDRGGSGYRGIYCRYCDNDLQIIENKIIGGAGYGINLYYCDGTSSNRGLIANNFVQVGGSANAAYGISEYDGSFLNFYYNSVQLTNTNASSRAFSTSYGNNKNLLNNIFANIGGGNAITVTGNSGIAASNFNDFYTSGSTLGNWNGNIATNIATWRAVSGRDFNSIDANPLFYSETDLHVLQVALDSAATTIPGITIDIDGNLRNTNKPDIGADEFDYLEDDLGVIALLTPSDECDLSNAEPVKVLIQNFGGLPQTGFDIAFGLTGGAVVTENVGNLIVLPGDTATFTFFSPIDLSAHLSYPIESYTLLAGDLNLGNDTLMTLVTNHQTPAMVSNMLPADGAINIDPPIDFSWLPSNGADSYDLYFWKQGDAQPATPIGQDLSQITYAYNNNNLIYGAEYNWQIVAKNDFCETPSPIQSFTLRELPDLIVNNVQLPNMPFSGQSIEVTWTVGNQAVGTTGMTNWYDYIYLSTDNVYQAGVDTYLGGFVNLTALNFNQSYSQMKTVNLPQGIQGTYYVFVVTDRNNSLIEGNNDNNVSVAASMSVNLTPPPDLTVTSIINPNQAFSGTSINVQWTVLNQGTGDDESSNHYDRIYLSQSPTFNIGNAIYLGQALADELPSDSSYTQIKSVNIPESIFGDYYIHVVTDHYNQVFEHVFEDNNVLTGMVMDIILTPPPDLIVSNIQAPGAADNRAAINLQWTVNNQGGTPTSGTFSDRIYISPHSEFDPDSIQNLTTVSTNTVINNGGSLNRSASVSIPANACDTQYFYIHTDVNNNIFEFINEDNNIGQSNAIIINNADLVVSSITVGDTLNSGTETTVQWTVTNQGIGAVLNYSRTDKVYISTDTTFDEMTATEVGSSTYSGVLTAGQSLSKQTTVNIPNGIQGEYFVYVFTDASNTVFEKDQENNNTIQAASYIKLSPWPDLQVNALSGLPTIATAGDLLTVTFEVENHGMAAVQGIGSWVDRVYISANPTWNPADVVTLKSLDVLQPVNPGGTYSLSSTFTLPMLGNNAGAGICYIYVYTDAEDKIFEHTDEGNNYKRSAPISVTAPPPVDFQVLNATGLPDTVFSGSEQNLQWMIQNNGSTTALWNYGLWYDGIYLSQDSIWNQQYDNFVKDFTKQGPVLPLETYSNNQMFNIPNGIFGDYYAFLVADHTEATNNVVDDTSVWKIRPQSFPTGQIKPIHIKLSPSPDLTVSNMVAPNSEFAGQPIQIIWTVTNNGQGATSGTWTDKVYLSTDFDISNNDPIIATKSQSRVVALGESYTDTIQAFIPINKVGNFVVILKTDANDALFEYNGENNNTFYTFLTTSLPLPSDLVINNITFDTMAMVGESFTVNYDLANQGSNPASGFMRELVYLSPDSVFDASDVKFTQAIDRNINLAPATTTSFSPAANTPGVPLGDYFVIVQTDILDNIYESNDTNNITISTQKVKVSIPELPLSVLITDTMLNNIGIYYRIEIPSNLVGETMLVSLDGKTAGGVNELYLSHGDVPTRSNHDFSFPNPFEADQAIVVPELKEGTYYLLAYGATTSDTEQEVDLKAEIIPFQVLNVEASRGGNSGNVTLKVEGAKFTEDMTLELTNPTLGTITAHKLTFINSTKVFATFNLAGASLGIYDMKATEGLNIDTLDNAFEVVEGGAGTIVGGGNGNGMGSFFCDISNVGTQHNLNKDIQHPAQVRVNRLVPITIVFGNGGNVDIPCPSRWLLSMRGAPLSFDPDDFIDMNQELYLEFQEPGGPTGILRPGSVATLTVYAYSSHPLRFVLRE